MNADVDINRSVKLSSLLADIATVDAANDCDIHGLAIDSRAVGDGFLFFAVPGVHADGRAYMQDAVNAGAHAVMYESTDYTGTLPAGATTIGLTDVRFKIGHVADRYYGSPTAHLEVLGVTGTNGKTSCVWLLAQALNHLGKRCAVLGTLGVMADVVPHQALAYPQSTSLRCPSGQSQKGQSQKGQARNKLATTTATLTTPDAIGIHRTAAQLLMDHDTSVLAMEVSSHGIDQGRVQGVDLNCAVFTNLSRDHLDYHKTMQAYGQTKSKLFSHPGLDLAVINIDDDFAQELLSETTARRVIRYGMNQGDVFCQSVKVSEFGLHIQAQTPIGRIEIKSPLIGRFNVANILAVVSVLIANSLAPQNTDAGQIGPQQIGAALSAAQTAPGRMEVFRTEDATNPRCVTVVDYAHTPDSLEKALDAVRSHCEGRVWCVFGCGGDRDRGKRAIMGAVAEKLADVVVITSDNPRSESPTQIVNDIKSGLTNSITKPVRLDISEAASQQTPVTLFDRREAIAYALSNARSEDWVLVAGKGHESVQVVGDVAHPFSDREVVRECLS